MHHLKYLKCSLVVYFSKNKYVRAVLKYHQVLCTLSQRRENVSFYVQGRAEGKVKEVEKEPIAPKGLEAACLHGFASRARLSSWPVLASPCICQCQICSLFSQVHRKIPEVMDILFSCMDISVIVLVIRGRSSCSAYM